MAHMIMIPDDPSILYTQSSLTAETLVQSINSPFSKKWWEKVDMTRSFEYTRVGNIPSGQGEIPDRWSKPTSTTRCRSGEIPESTVQSG